MASDVFFMNDRANSVQESIKFKAVKVFRDAGLGELFKPGDTVGIKIHMGEYGNSHNLRPQWIRSIVEEIQRLKANPVIVDCNTIPFTEFTSRATKADHLRTAARHGYTEETMTCPIWICDGDYGFDDVKVEIPHGVLMRHTYMGKKFEDLDAMIVVSHFKGHPMGVFGGAMKNVGIGCGSKRGKLCTHLMNDPYYGRKAWPINQAAAAALAQGEHPTAMDRFIKACPADCVKFENGMLHYDPDKCQQCLTCFMTGLFSGMLQAFPETVFLWAPTMVDACAGYVNAIGSEKIGYVNYAMDVTPWCDCVNWHDRALVPNIGVFASKDPVAVDMACLEATEAVAGTPGAKADDFGFGEPGSERFTNCSSMAKVSQWAQINTGVYNGLGTSEYNLIISEPAPEYDFWMKPYSPENPWGYANREALQAGNFKPDVPFTYESLRLSMTELSIKPKGKVRELDFADLVAAKV
jgi:uncharacterized protein